MGNWSTTKLVIVAVSFALGISALCIGLLWGSEKLMQSYTGATTQPAVQSTTTQPATEVPEPKFRDAVVSIVIPGATVIKVDRPPFASHLRWVEAVVPDGRHFKLVTDDLQLVGPNEGYILFVSGTWVYSRQAPRTTQQATAPAP